MVLPRGLAPRSSAFAERRAELLHFGSYELNESKTLRHAGAAPAPAVWKTAVLAVTPMALEENGCVRYRAGLSSSSARR